MDEEDEDDMYAPEEGPVPSQDTRRSQGNATTLQPKGGGIGNDEEDEEEGEEVEEDESDSVGAKILLVSANLLTWYGAGYRYNR